MTPNGKHEQLRLGFLTAVEVPEKGFVGGLLVTNQHGRPLEFQCTAPVRPNATQEILFGPTLRPFVIGELIGGALVAKAAVRPRLILTDRHEALELRNHVDQPVALVETDDGSRADEAGGPVLRVGSRRLRFHAAHAADRAAVETEARVIPASADLGEPFDRVRDALAETLRASFSK